MASVCNDGEGQKRIIFTAPDGRRVAIKGHFTDKQARTMAGHLEELSRAHHAGESPRTATADWLADLPERTHRRLVKIGFARQRVRKEAPALAAWLETYIGNRTDVKAGTRTNLGQTRRYLLDHFGEAKRLDEITAADADAFRIGLKGRGLAEATIRRQCKRARQFLSGAVKARIIDENPFADLPCSDFANDARRRFVPQEDIEKVMELCPMTWKVVFGLSRFAGLRMPSEARLLKWEDVLWDKDKLVVTSPKTEGRGKGSRTLPLFPRLRELLLSAFEAAETGQKYVCEILRDGRENPRTEALRFIRRAGLDPWPRLFQNLRASLESELMAVFPIHTVTRWLGNTPAVALKHYATDRPEDFDRAIEWRPGKGAQKRARSEAETGRRDAQQKSPGHAEDANSGAFCEAALSCAGTETQAMTPSGFEPELQA